ncbi:MAG TPA: thioredoxin family protein [Paracoccus sp.]|nr:thioredoxin family protein [Paracoccus sp. (in: a-proteobacteria)]
MAASPPIDEFGWKAPLFRLPTTDGRTLSYIDVAGPKGTLVMFLCNHCPYVLALLDRICRDARDLHALGVGVAAICSNDAIAWPQDSFANMQELARDHALPFPYLHDESQSVARAYGAACTPDFFGFNAGGELQYRGRLDADGRNTPRPGTRRELYEAMRRISETGEGPRVQHPSIGCSIKWRAEV